MVAKRRVSVVSTRMTIYAAVASLFAALAMVVAISDRLGGLQDEFVAAFFVPHPQVLVVAARTLPVGHQIADEDLRRQPFSSWTPEGILTDPAAVIGRTVTERILDGDFFREVRFAERRKTQGGLNALLPMGSRAMSINLSGSDRVDDFLEPGDRVDVLVTLFVGSTTGETIRLLSLVPVLAVDGAIDDGGSAQAVVKAQITLEVKDEDAERLALALRTGRPRVVIRSERDLAGDP